MVVGGGRSCGCGMRAHDSLDSETLKKPPKCFCFLPTKREGRTNPTRLGVHHKCHLFRTKIRSAPSQRKKKRSQYQSQMWKRERHQITSKAYERSQDRDDPMENIGLSAFVMFLRRREVFVEQKPNHRCILCSQSCLLRNACQQSAAVKRIYSLFLPGQNSIVPPCPTLAVSIRYSFLRKLYWH